MNRAARYVFVRHRDNWIQLFRFGLVGGSGILVNNLVFILANKIWSHPDDIVFSIPGTDFNIRWQLIYSTIAFLVANLWNFMLNRHWTFAGANKTRWWRQYWPFMIVGLGAQLVTMLLETLMINPTSPTYLPGPPFTDGTTGFTNRFYWAHLIAIIITVPITFILNKLWTFSAIRKRRRHPEELPTVPMVATVVAPEMESQAEQLLADQAEAQEQQSPGTQRSEAQPPRAGDEHNADHTRALAEEVDVHGPGRPGPT